MNHLHRIVLVNSGNIDFQEINLDGNIHFIGTQGTGKSTLLRAILFFYNASSTKLGISKEKKSFAEFYFPNADSYIFYEVVKGDRSFCVCLYKKMNRLCFRFIDGAYSRDLILKDNRALNEAELLKRINEKGYKLSPAIYNFTEYRDVIYGANKSMKQYSLLDNKKYNNIPLTLSNVFLNSSLDGGFIKNTIINSLNENSFIIDLETNKRHVESARLGYRDVACYIDNQSKAMFIVDIYNKILEQESSKSDLAYSIGASYNYFLDKKPLLEENISKINTNIDAQQEVISRIKSDFADSQRISRDKLSVVKSDILKANKLSKKYQSEDISEVLNLNSQEDKCNLVLKQLTTQHDLLITGLEDIEKNYQLSIKETVSDTKAAIAELGEDIRKKQKTQSSRKEEVKDTFYHKKENFLALKDKINADLYSQRSNYEKEILKIEYQISSIKTKAYFVDQLSDLEKEKYRLSEDIQKLNGDLKICKLKVENTSSVAENENNSLSKDNKLINEKIKEELFKLSTEIKTITNQINSFSGSLIEFIVENKISSSESILKLLDRDILLRDDLKPQIVAGDSFYGLSLNLSDLDTVQLSKKNLEQQLLELDKQKDKLNSDLEQESVNYNKKRALLNKKYSKQISEQRDQIKKLEAEIIITNTRKEKNLLDKESFLSKIEQERKQELEIKQKDKSASQKERNNIQELINKQELTCEKQIKELTKNKDAELSSIHKEINILEENLKNSIKTINVEKDNVLNKLEAERKKTLINKGVDVDVMSKLDLEIKLLNDKLKKIHSNKEYIAIYNNDCSEYIDKLPEFKLNRKSIEEELSHKTNLYNARKSKEQEKHKDLDKQCDVEKKNLNKLDSEIHAYLSFEKENLFQELKAFIINNDKKENTSCKESIDKLKNISLAYEKQSKVFTEKINEFSSLFSIDNTFKFNVEIKTELEYRIFAQNIDKFISENMILDFKREVTCKYAQVLNNIATETKQLLSRESEVHKLILKINNDFRNSNFVGVVKSIEMRALESSDKMIQVLRKVCDYHDNNNMQIGDINLFNQMNSDTSNSEAIALLDEYLNILIKSDFKSLSLEQVFDLEFRIKENDNDTNWVKRLANVGSNGTDVLVKSMIYINLLNIFKNTGSKNNSDLMLHCIIDEVGILHDSNITGLIGFASKRNICLINGSPNSHNEQDYKHIYLFCKDANTSKTGIIKLVSNEM